MIPKDLSVTTVLLLLFGVVLLVSAQQQPRGGNQNGASCSNNYQFDQLVLSIQWPLSFCYQKQECNLAAARKKRWYIHGLWPNRSQRSGGGGGQNRPKSKRNGNNNNGFNDIAFCCGPAYNQSGITTSTSLQQELLDKWPTLQSGAKHHGFWRHEWQKHGTCARGVTGLKNQQQYFETVLGLYNRFNLNRATSVNSTVSAAAAPSLPALQSNQTYQLDKFHQVLEPLVGGKRIRVECSFAGNQGSNNNKTSIFSEVHICLDKTLQPIDCERGDDHQCRKKVLFP